VPKPVRAPERKTTSGAGWWELTQKFQRRRRDGPGQASEDEI
jgi:hypothetical protein